MHIPAFPFQYPAIPFPSLTPVPRRPRSSPVASCFVPQNRPTRVADSTFSSRGDRRRHKLERAEDLSFDAALTLTNPPALWPCRGSQIPRTYVIFSFSILYVICFFPIFFGEGGFAGVSWLQLCLAAIDYIIVSVRRFPLDCIPVFVLWGKCHLLSFVCIARMPNTLPALNEERVVCVY